ncbi:MAG: RagB/SusD family nutrient uptake outer membrane protein [Bacteroidetes bacterium]|nr:RagB/SusD family nutrient uptake outer membrane protein [Bacteroidota bacterium]
MKKIIFYISFILTLVCSTQCTTDDLDPTLAQEKELGVSINNFEDLQGILKGALNRMTQSDYYGRYFIIYDEIRGDHVFANGNSGRFQTEGTLQYIPSNNRGIWSRAYAVIASSNIIINVDLSKIDGEANKTKHIQGQAYLLRGLAHFDLLRQYGQQYASSGKLGIPYVTNYKGKNTIPPRNTIAETVSNIYKDFDSAYSMMNDAISNDKQYPSKLTAKALESRLALYMGDWNRAEVAAKVVIDSGKYTIAKSTDYVASFENDNTSNSIFELAFSSTDNIGINGLGYIYRGVNYGDIEVLPFVKSIFDTVADIRYGVFGYEGKKFRNMGKYPELQGYDNISVIRIEEVFLNYAEALMEQGKNTEALEQINKLVNERGIPKYSGTLTKDQILIERQRELIFEGFRFFDLTRTGKGIPIVDQLQNISKAVPANDYRLALPIPLVEMDANSNMIQNSGYD